MFGLAPAAILMRLALVAALAAGVWAFWHHYTGLIAERARLEAAFADAVQAFDDESASHEATRAEAARTGALLAKRTTIANQHAEEARRYEKLLADARRDPAAMQWLDAPVPRAVWCGLRNRPEGVDCNENGKGAPPAGPAGRDAKPQADRLDRLRLAHVLATPGIGADQLQR